MMRRSLCALLLAFTMGGGCARLNQDKDDAFVASVKALQGESYYRAANASWSFLSNADPEDPRYPRGQRLLASSLEGLDMDWAAGLMYRQIAQERRDMELVPDAIRRLQAIVEQGQVDQDTFVTSFLASEEFSSLPEDVQSFVDYHKGLELARRGIDDWADVHFSQIPAGDPYADRAAYVHVVRQVAAGDYATAVAGLIALQSRPDLPRDVRLDVERTLARIAFEEQRYADALTHFEVLREVAPDDPGVLLEMAWTHYYQSAPRETLGLLLALDAPVHSDYVAPEAYLLEALALRQLCQFQAARAAAIKLQVRHDDAFEALRAGALPGEVPELLQAAQLRGQSRENYRFVRRLEAEQQMAKDLRLSGELRSWLADRYDQGVEQAMIQHQVQLDTDLDILAEELLGAREGVKLIVHELGVALLRGRRRPAGAVGQPEQVIPLSTEVTFYGFNGEYWTDEMDDLIVLAEDRCMD